MHTSAKGQSVVSVSVKIQGLILKTTWSKKNLN